MTARFALSNAEQRYRDTDAADADTEGDGDGDSDSSSRHERPQTKLCTIVYRRREGVCSATPEIVARNEIVLHYRQIN